MFKGFNMNSYTKCNNFGYLSTDDRLKGNNSPLHYTAIVNLFFNPPIKSLDF